MKRYVPLLRYARPYWKNLVAILVTMVMSVALSVLQPWPLTIFVDYVLGEKTLGAATESQLQWLPGGTPQKSFSSSSCCPRWQLRSARAYSPMSKRWPQFGSTSE